MLRTLLVAVLVSLPAVSPAVAQDKKGEKPPANFFPLAKGTKWEYVMKGYEEAQWVAEVTDVTAPEKGERAVVTITSTIAKQVLTAKYSADEKAVFEHTRGSQEMARPLVMLKLPVKAGSTWTEKFKYVGDVTADYEVKDAVELKLPAGKYTAYPVVQSINTTLGKSTVTNWYADGVGMVKQEIKAFGKPDVIELKAFSPAKAK